ncbi:MAG TPA: hypothetical protein VFZ15_04515 [Acidimicrobiia bacterium]|nr:hypothetical protein [Acidimicrobiia bacterium]
MSGDQRRVIADRDENEPSSSPGIRLWVVGLGLIAILAVVWTTGRNAPPSDAEAVAVTTTTTTTPTTSTAVDDPIPRVGEPLSWQPAGSIEDTWPLSVVEHQGLLYLFTTDGIDFESRVGNGLDAWVSEDGSSWEPRGSVVPPPHQVQSVISTSRGLMAIGASGEDGSPRVWMSTDAGLWSEAELPIDGSDVPAGSRTYLHAPWAGDELLLVFASTYVATEQILLDALPEAVRPATGRYRYGMDWGGDPFQISVQGPLGIPVFSATAEELGLSEEQIELLEGPGIVTPVMVWSSLDGETWARFELEASSVGAVAPNPGGGLMMVGYGMRGELATWTSSNGFEWVPVDAIGMPDIVVPWNDGLIGTRYSGSHPDLVHSEDGEEWESFGVDRLLAEDVSWYFGQPSAGATGAAFVAHGYDPSDQSFEPPPVVLEKDGYTLTRDNTDGTLVLERDDSVVLQLSPHSGQVIEGVTVDFETETITFSDPETDRAHVTFTFEEIEQAETEAYGAPGREPQILFFAQDGLEWSVQEMGRIVGDDRAIGTLLVTERGVIAATYAFPNVPTGSPPAPNIEMWLATLDSG